MRQKRVPRRTKREPPRFEWRQCGWVAWLPLPAIEAPVLESAERMLILGALIVVTITAGSRDSDDAAGKTHDPGAASLLDRTVNACRQMTPT